MPSFTIDTDPFEFRFLWECEMCEVNNRMGNHMGKRGAIAAYRAALKHATNCLRDHRTREGTDVWAVDYTPEDFLAELISVEARGSGYPR